MLYHPNKNVGGKWVLRQINTCRKVPLQVPIFMKSRHLGLGSISYLVHGQDCRFRPFMPNGNYCQWQPYEVNQDRIVNPAGKDGLQDLPSRIRDLRTFIHLITERIASDHRLVVRAQATSLPAIYLLLKGLYNLLSPGSSPIRVAASVLSLVNLRPEDSAAGLTGASVLTFYLKFRNRLTGCLGVKARQSCVNPCGTLVFSLDLTSRKVSY